MSTNIKKGKSYYSCVKMNHLLQLSNQMKDVNPTLAQFYIKEMLQVSEKAQIRVLVSAFIQIY